MVETEPPVAPVATDFRRAQVVPLVRAVRAVRAVLATSRPEIRETMEIRAPMVRRVRNADLQTGVDSGYAGADSRSAV